MTASGPLLEICIDSPDGLASAIDGGADRIELCSALALGGLTPSPGFMRLAAGAMAPVRAMIRPHADGFVFSERDAAVMMADIDAAGDAGLEGIVVGGLTPDGRLDEVLLRRLVAHAGDLKVTLHRVVDLLDDPLEAVRFASDEGIDAILTSGGAPVAAQGLPWINAMRAAADGRVRIMVGGGVAPEHVAAFLALGVDAVHASCGRPVATRHDQAEALGLGSSGQRRTDRDLVRALRDQLDGVLVPDLEVSL